MIKIASLLRSLYATPIVLLAQEPPSRITWHATTGKHGRLPAADSEHGRGHVLSGLTYCRFGHFGRGEVGRYIYYFVLKMGQMSRDRHFGKKHVDSTFV